MKVTLHFFWKQYDWEDVGELFAVSGDEKVPKAYESNDLIFLRTVEVDVPNIEEPTRDQISRAKVTALKTKRQAIMAESQIKLNAIDDKIKQLSCIEYKAEQS